MATAKVSCTTLTSTALSLTLLQKRKLDSISDGPAPSEPETKRHHTTNRCRLTELPNELLILIAEHLAGFDDPITYVHLIDGKLIIEHPKAYHDVSLAGLRDLSDTLCVEFEKALHKNGIITFEDQFAFVQYFNPEILNSHPPLKNIRLATQRVRLNLWSFPSPNKWISKMRPLVNLKRVHLGGAWRGKKVPIEFSPSKATADIFRYDVYMLLYALQSDSVGEWKYTKLPVTFGPGRFGRNTIHSGEKFGNRLIDGGNNHATFDELVAIWNEDQGILPCTGSIVSMDEQTLSSIREILVRLEIEGDQFEV